MSSPWTVNPRGLLEGLGAKVRVRVDVVVVVVGAVTEIVANNNYFLYQAKMIFVH